MDDNTNINDLPDVNLAQIFEKLPRKVRLEIEQVCKRWHYVGKNLSWTNYRIFYNYKLSYPRTLYISEQIKPFFERCGRHLRHITLSSWPAQNAVTILKIAPNVQHLSFICNNLNDESLKELAQILPNLKSLSLHGNSSNETDYNIGLTECFKTMLSLEYLSISANGPLFSLYSFVQFPSSLKYLDLYNVSNAGQILNWVAKECCNLKGLCLSVTESVIQVIPQLKGTYLALIEPDGTKWISLDIGYVLESLTELRALLIQTLDEKVISAIARYCKKLEHLTIRKGFGVHVTSVPKSI